MAALAASLAATASVALPVTRAAGKEAGKEAASSGVALSDAWVSTPDKALLLAHPQSSTASPAVTLTADGTQRFQTWLGAGGALTDAATQLLGSAGASLRAQLFSPTAERGARLDLVRMPLSATDFSTRGWTWQDSSGATPQPPAEALASIREVKRLLALEPDLKVVTASWSAPAWMKSTGVLNGGALNQGSLPSYANLLLAQVRRLRAAGIPVVATTLGNEPFHSASSYPTMTMTDSQMSELAGLVGLPLADRGVELWGLDHNWVHRPHVDAQLSSPTGRRFARVAFHCYQSESGDSALATSLQRPWALTECTGGDWDPSWASTFQWQATHLVTDPVRRGSTGLLLWNLALDPSHGPHTGGCDGCRGVVTVDPVAHTWTANPEYYLLAHLTRAADPGARRIGLTMAGDLPAVAFANPDGTVGYFGVNTGTTRVVRVVAGTASARFSVPAGALWSVRLPGSSLAPETDLSGHLVQWNGDGANPRTTWLVTPDRRRLWVPDVATYDCLVRAGAVGPQPLDAALLDQLFDQTGLWAPCGDRLTAHRTLRKGMAITSPSGAARVSMAGSGELQLLVDGSPVWSSLPAADFVTLQEDGDLVGYSDLGRRVWHTGTAGRGADRLVVTDTGKMRLMAGDRIVWTRG